MKIFKEPRQLQRWAKAQKLAGKRIALVPTMGYLHEGHLSLIAKAKAKGAQEIIVSVFVNPVQFCPGEDYEKYPRDEKADLEKCRAAGATAIFFPTPAKMYAKDHSVYFFPTPAKMYAKDHSVYVNEELLSRGLCGARRPGHFRGVCTVVAKLFNLAHPDFAVFGQKDYQQAQIIRRMVRDLNFDLEIVVAPIVRETTGLARSSRNTYLSDEEKTQAIAISRALKELKSAAKARALGAGAALRAVARKLAAAGLKVDYVEAVNDETLETVKTIKKGVAVLVAAYCGKTRLIDNMIV